MTSFYFYLMLFATMTISQSQIGFLFVYDFDCTSKCKSEYQDFSSNTHKGMSYSRHNKSKRTQINILIAF